MKKSFILAIFFLLTFSVVNAQKVAGSKMTWVKLYPILKKSLLESTCEPSVIFEENTNSISVNSEESDFFLSAWVWDLVNRPLLIEDIDNDQNFIILGLISDNFGDVVLRDVKTNLKNYVNNL